LDCTINRLIDDGYREPRAPTETVTRVVRTIFGDVTVSVRGELPGRRVSIQPMAHDVTIVFGPEQQSDFMRAFGMLKRNA
jgi:hypothetical protein